MGEIVNHIVGEPDRMEPTYGISVGAPSIKNKDFVGTRVGGIFDLMVGALENTAHVIF